MPRNAKTAHSLDTKFWTPPEKKKSCLLPTPLPAFSRPLESTVWEWKNGPTAEREMDVPYVAHRASAGTQTERQGPYGVINGRRCQVEQILLDGLCAAEPSELEAK